VNSRFVPGEMTKAEPSAAPATAAIVTASYAPDFERCRLLCETIDRFVTGMSRHYILVEDRDVALFRALEGPRRVVVGERDLLPGWLRPYGDPLSGFRRRIWLSLKTQPLRGWHVQQLRRIAIAAHVSEPVLVYCDSDVAFLKPFDCGNFWSDGKVRLFRRDNAIAPDAESEQKTWSVNAGKTLGITEPAWSPHDYIATLISWRRDTVQAMCRRIETVHSCHWVEAVASVRKFSECMLYGRFADEVERGAGHFHAGEEFCRVHWTGEALSDDEFRAFVASMTPDQVAIGMQSFIGTDLGRIRRLLAA
jgi:hypothetical protein